MTFYEAALRVLEREGKPLHVDAITEIALAENFLSHVGKSPQEVMQSRLLSMARRRTERKVVATAPLTYGLVEWNLPEDPAALTVAPEQPNENEPPLRPRERHPIPSPDKVRVAGRGERLRKVQRREEEREERRARRRYPPLSEVAFEVLSQAQGPLAAVDLAAAARERELVSEDLGAEALLNALREDNRRRTEAGRKPAFTISPAGEVSLERGAAAAEGTVELEAAFAFALGVPLTEGKVERGPGASRLLAQTADHRRQILRLVRRRLGDMDVAAFERAALALLEAHAFREARVARRGKDGLLVTARRKDGLADLRWAVQIKRGGPEIGRDEVEELRKEVPQLGAQMGLLLSPADVTRDARADATSGSGAPLILWCADALSEKFAEAKLGATATTVEVWDLDEEFYRRCRDKGREEERARRAREEPRLAPAPAPAAPVVPPAAAAPQEKLAPRPQPSEAERTSDAAALAAELTAGERQAAEERRRLEERLRLEAHERIEAAELQARLKRAPAPTA